jgi:BirA family biotin operon repressor/biotin-[acetyl-CoA-carboxylase] ligase
MDALPLSAREVPSLVLRDTSPSTNSELLALLATTDLPDLTTLVTDDQTAGRGRLDRVWAAPAGTSLAISVLLRLPAGLSTDALGWLPLAAGVAMTDAVAAHVTGIVGFKWPNDVQIDGLKVCGILSELAPGGAAVVIGSGLNVGMSADQLPVPTATSLALSGAVGDDVADRVLAAYLRELRVLVGALWTAGGDADASGLRVAAAERCTSIGRPVRAELPGGSERSGVAVGIDRLGRLEVRDDSGRVEPVAAGDIIHLR